MEVIKTEIDGLLLIKPKVFNDERGYFFEGFNKNNFVANGINSDFVQDNISKSKKGTIRGLHYQIGEKAQGKLCYVISGKVLDVAVDIRFGSPTFGKYFSSELSEENHKQLWLPRDLHMDFQFYQMKQFLFINAHHYTAKNMNGQ